jgi:hypothetical protein
METQPKNFYRYEDHLDYWNFYLNIPKLIIREINFKLVKETPKGYWIKQISILPEDERWVSKSSRNRYAFPTKAEAINNFLHRKSRQISILDKKLQQAKKAFDQGMQMKEEEEIKNAIKTEKIEAQK